MRRVGAGLAALRAAGAVILGKTNTPEMAGDWQTYNKLFGTTNNPWDIKRTPGGSSGGGADSEGTMRKLPGDLVSL